MNEKLKVLTIGTDAKLFEEGSGVSKRMVEYGKVFDELHVIVLTGKGHVVRRIAENVWAYPTNSRLRILSPIKALFVAAKIVRNAGLTRENAVVSVQDPFETGFVGALMKRTYGFPLQVQVHTDMLNPRFANSSLLNRFRVTLAGFVMPRADAVRVVSERVKRDVIGEYGLHPERIAVLPIWVDMKRIEDAEVKTGLRERYPQFDFIALVASRLTREKNIYLALGAMADIIRRHPKAGLVIVGSGPEKAGLELRTFSLGIEKHVAFEEWQNDLVSYFKTADVLLFPSWFEGDGMTLREAAAAGCPIVATDVGTAREVLGPELSEFVCPVGDPESFRKALQTLVESPAERTGCRKALQERARELGSTKEEYLERYRESMFMARQD